LRFTNESHDASPYFEKISNTLKLLEQPHRQKEGAELTQQLNQKFCAVPVLRRAPMGRVEQLAKPKSRAVSLSVQLSQQGK
jgi:hypothetical protein